MTQVVPENNVNFVTKKERWAFYAFSFANQPFLTTILGLCTPVILESLAAGAGVDKSTLEPCNTKVKYDCKVKLGNIWFDTTSFALYTSVIIVILQVIIFISIGSIADYGKLRKVMLITASMLSGFTLLFLPIVNNYQYFWVASLLIIIANVSCGTGYVFYYAYLPILTRNSEEVVKSYYSTTDTFDKTKEFISNRISGNGFAIGYLGGFLNLGLAELFTYFAGDFGPVYPYPMQVVCAITGAWIIVFDLIPVFWLKNREGEKLPPGENYLLYSWKQIIRTFKHIKYLSQLFLLLISWFIISDTFQTIVSVVILIAKKDLTLSQEELIISAMMVPIFAGVGALFWNFIRSKTNYSTKITLIIICALYSLLSVYILLGLSQTINFGLKRKWETYLIIGFHGFLVGAIQSFYRVLYSAIIPKGKESEFFSMYQVTSKGSAWIGPLVVGAIANNSPIRLGFIFFLVSTIISIIILILVDINKALKQASKFEIISEKA